MPSIANGNTGAKQLQKNRRLYQRIFCDFLIFIVLIIPIIVCEYVIEPFRRGFFCDDEIIRYPFKPNTITPIMLGVIVGLPPVIVLAIGEYARHHNRGQLGNTRQIFGLHIAVWLTNTFKQFIYFCFGLLLTIDAIELGKYTIGRLRPYFISVCQPQLVDGTTCYDLVNQYRYVENYFCLGTGFTAQDVRQSRLSFPSGHSSLAFYSSVYISVYLQKRTQWQRSDLTKNFIQYSLLMLAWFTSLSRIMDNWHHWSDVLAGSLIGVLIALITANYVSKFFTTSYTDFGSLRLAGLARQDTSATLNEVLAATPPPYTINQKQVEDDFTTETYCTKV